MKGPDKTKEITTANRAAWEEAAPIHGQQNQAQSIKEFSRPGFSCLDQFETRRLEALGIALEDTPDGTVWRQE